MQELFYFLPLLLSNSVNITLRQDMLLNFQLDRKENVIDLCNPCG